MTRSTRVLSQYSCIEPYQQGELSSFCGVYAAINAARLVSGDLANYRPLWKEAYAISLSSLSRRRQLKDGLKRGLTFDTWRFMQSELYEQLSAITDLTYRMRPLVRRKRPSQPLPSMIHHAIDSNHAVLCWLTNTHSHFTVIAGYTPSRWLLFDSHGLRWIASRSTSIGTATALRHHIPQPSLVVLQGRES